MISLVPKWTLHTQWFIGTISEVTFIDLIHVLFGFLEECLVPGNTLLVASFYW
jgi:hypothetical protein